MVLEKLSHEYHKFLKSKNHKINQLILMNASNYNKEVI